MEICNKDIICLRTVDSDETGLLLSIPFPVFYKYSDPVTNIADIEIELCNRENNAVGFARFGLLDKQFILLDSDGRFLGHKNDFIVITNNEKYSRKMAFSLFVETDIPNQSLKIYDGFYYLYTNPDSEIFNNMVYFFSPCYLNAVYGYNPENSIYPNNMQSKRTSLLIDQYTNRIQGVVSDFDCLFSEHNQVVVNNDDFIPVRNEIKNITGLVNNYSYVNGNVVRTDFSNTGIKTLEKIRANIKRIRTLQIQTSKYAVCNALFHEFKNVRKTQRLLHKKHLEILKITKEVLNMQMYIKQQKQLAYQKKCEMFLSTNNFKYYASVCLLIKDENDYLEEWLKHYESIGIQHFYIYDNKSKIQISDTVHMIDDGHFDDMCTIIPFTSYKNNMQYECYENCLSSFGNESRWIGFFDTDEFVDIKDNSICEFLKKYEDFFCVWIPWEIYNANGRLNKLNYNMNVLFSTPCTDPFGLWGKVFVQPHRTKHMYVHLATGLAECERAVNTDFKDHLYSYEYVFKESRNGNLHLYSDAKIRHYITRSFEEWCDKMKRGSCDPNFRRKFNVFFDYNPDMIYLKNEQEVQKLIDTKQGYS